MLHLNIWRGCKYSNSFCETMGTNGGLQSNNVQHSSIKVLPLLGMWSKVSGKLAIFSPLKIEGEGVNQFSEKLKT